MNYILEIILSFPLILLAIGLLTMPYSYLLGLKLIRIGLTILAIFILTIFILALWLN